MNNVIQILIFNILIIPGIMHGSWFLYSPEAENEDLTEWQFIRPDQRTDEHVPPREVHVRLDGASNIYFTEGLDSDHYEYYLEGGYHFAGPSDVYASYFRNFFNEKPIRISLYALAGMCIGAGAGIKTGHMEYATGGGLLLGTAFGAGSCLLRSLKKRPYAITAGRSFLEIIRADDASACKAACTIDKRFINGKDYYSEKNALYYAARFGNKNVYDALIAMGAKTSFPKHTQSPTLKRILKFSLPYICAASSVGLGIKSFLSKIQSDTKYYGLLAAGLAGLSGFLWTQKSDLKKAVLENDIDETRQALIDGTDVNVKDAMGKTALMHAFTEINNYTQISLINLLLENGADVHAEDNSDRSALYYLYNAEVNSERASKIKNRIYRLLIKKNLL